jgi:hypothetical protein
MTTHQSPHSNNDQPLYNLKDFDHFGRGDYTEYPIGVCYYSDSGLVLQCVCVTCVGISVHTSDGWLIALGDINKCKMFQFFMERGDDDF